MNKETDLEGVKRIAKGLLNVSILETDYSPMIVSHPFTKSGIVAMVDGDDFVHLNIVENKESFNKWAEMMSRHIDEAKNVYHIYYLLNDSYRLLFLVDVAQYLSQEDYSVILADAWVGCEYANMDANVSKKEILEHFKKADKEKLMSESELEIYDGLDESVVVYRGVSSKNKSNVKALSWTLNFEKAKWFAERWGKRGTIYSAVIDKKDILAYFDSKSEDEVVVDFNGLQDIRVVDKPLPKPQPNAKIME